MEEPLEKIHQGAIFWPHALIPISPVVVLASPAITHRLSVLEYRRYCLHSHPTRRAGWIRLLRPAPAGLELIFASGTLEKLGIRQIAFSLVRNRPCRAHSAPASRTRGMLRFGTFPSKCETVPTARTTHQLFLYWHGPSVWSMCFSLFERVCSFLRRSLLDLELELRP